MTVHKIITAMDQHGGSFVRALAAAWRLADPVNKEIIEHAFAHLFKKYKDEFCKEGK
jgi:hypothetical protein